MGHTSTITQTNVTDNAKAAEFWENAEFNRYGIYAMTLLIMGCLGGVAAGFVGGNLAALSVIVVLSMNSLATLLAVQPMKVVVYSAAAAVIVDILIITAFSIM